MATSSEDLLSFLVPVLRRTPNPSEEARLTPDAGFDDEDSTLDPCTIIVVVVGGTDVVALLGVDDK